MAAKKGKLTKIEGVVSPMTWDEEDEVYLFCDHFRSMLRSLNQ